MFSLLTHQCSTSIYEKKNRLSISYFSYFGKSLLTLIYCKQNEFWLDNFSNKNLLAFVNAIRWFLRVFLQLMLVILLYLKLKIEKKSYFSSRASCIGSIRMKQNMNIRLNMWVNLSNKSINKKNNDHAMKPHAYFLTLFVLLLFFSFDKSHKIYVTKWNR